MERLPQLSEGEFEQIEEEIARTVKGRAFLRRFRRQALGAATEEVRAMLEEFKLSWRQNSQSLQAANRIDVLRQELIDMAASIERARREIAALQPADADNNKIISATSELDAIVISTERASFEILNAAERLMDASARFREAGADPELCSSVEQDISAIFTACSFQDLTGQRTGKVVNALRYIEQRITAMINIWGVDGEAALDEPAFTFDHREDAHLLNGPQLEGKGVSQQDVDAMFGAMSGPPAASADDDTDDDSEDWEPSPAMASPFGGSSRPPINQADIDALLNGAPPPPVATGLPQSQADIDSLFDDPPPPKAAAAKPAAPPPPPKPAAPAAKAQSQADIDSLFDAPAPAKPAAAAKPAAPPPPPKPAAPAAKAQSQADIDSLFDAPAPAPAKPAAAASKPAAPPPPAKPKAKAPEPLPAPTPLDQSAIDALFG